MTRHCFIKPSVLGISVFHFAKCRNGTETREEKRHWGRQKAVFLFLVTPSLLQPLSVERGGLETLWADLTFGHQADYVSRRSVPFKPLTQAHDTLWLHQDLSFVFVFCSVFSNLWVYGSLRTERQGCRKDKTHTAVEKHKRRKMNGRMVCFVNIMTRVFKSKMYDAVATHAQFARCPMLSVMFLCSKTDAKNFSVSTLQLFLKQFSCASDARSCETRFFGKISPVLLPFPPKKPRIWLFNCNLIGWWREITDCVTALQGKTYCGQASDGQVPEAEAVFYSHLDSYADNTLARQRECVAQPYN